jgi:hypothetical protein
MANTKEEIISNVLNEHMDGFSKWSVGDQKRLVGAIVQGLITVEKSELELKRKAASEEISAKLKIAEEICTWQDKLKKIPFYKFSERREIKLKILELQSQLQYEYIRRHNHVIYRNKAERI